MKLYSNVLWANWDRNLLLDGRIIIIGNSFKRYNDAMANDVKETTIPHIIPYVKETNILVAANKKCDQRENNRMKKSSLLSWEEVNNALSSCIISFHGRSEEEQEGDDREFPSRPEVSTDSSDELL